MGMQSRGSRGPPGSRHAQPAMISFDRLDGCRSAGISMEWRCHVNRQALLLLSCVLLAASYARADDTAAMAVLRAGCTADVQRLCANVQPGGGAIIACLRAHKDALSDRCKQAAQKAAGMSGNAAINPPDAPPPPSPPTSAPAQPAPQASSSSPARTRSDRRQCCFRLLPAPEEGADHDHHR